MTLFARIGMALYYSQPLRPGAGLSTPDWRKLTGVLAGRLQVDVRVVQRWASGETFPPPGVWRELETMVRQQNRESFALLEEIRKISLNPTGKES